jgi:bifunctional DNase/RNase
MIEMTLSQIVISEMQESQIIVLKEKDGSRSFPIVIGFFEAAAIDRNVKEIQTPRPLTHALLASVITSLSGTLEKIIVTELKKSTFHAKLVIRRNGSIVEVDSRPSDAIAIAVAVKCPIFVEEAVLDEVCRWNAPSEEEEE